MSEIRFYHLQSQSLDQALPALLGKALEGGRRVVIKTDDEKEMERLNEYLWTHRPDSFLPHGTKKDGDAESQAIWLTCDDENPNEADVLVLTGACESQMHDQFSLCCEMLNGNNQEAVTAARARWKTYKDAGHDVTYWQQGAQGGWENKA